MRKVIYTCLVGGYDRLLQPVVVDRSFDYICFSNDFCERQVGVWIIRKIPAIKDSNNVRLSRYPKLMPHKMLENYDVSIYIDANIQIVSKAFYATVNLRINEGHLICQVPHPFRDCIYEDIRMVYRLRRGVSLMEARRQYTHLKENYFPSHYGLFENNIILRRHNNKEVIRISEEWWNEYMHYTQRDQFSLMYVYWKQNYMPSYLFDSEHNVRNTDSIVYIKHPQKLPFYLRNKSTYKWYMLFHSRIRLPLALLFIR